MAQMKPIDLKEAAKRFTEKHHPDWVSRFDRIWDMFEKIDPKSLVSDSVNSQSHMGNAFGITGTADPSSQECMGGIAVFAFTYQDTKDKSSISQDDVKKKISMVPVDLTMHPGLQKKIEDVVSEILPSMDIKVEEQPENKIDEKMPEYNHKLSSVETSGYRVWYNSSEPSGLPIAVVAKEKIVIQDRHQYDLFIVREEARTQIFIEGNLTTSKPSKTGYRILTFALKFRGNCGTAWNIAKHLYDIEEAEKFNDLREMARAIKEQPKLKIALGDFKDEAGGIENYSNRIRRLINSLNKGFLICLNTKLKANNMDEYEINPMINYCLIEKIKF